MHIHLGKQPQHQINHAIFQLDNQNTTLGHKTVFMQYY